VALCPARFAGSVAEFFTLGRDVWQDVRDETSKIHAAAGTNLVVMSWHLSEGGPARLGPTGDWGM
jgi:hypothetical protein